MPWVSKRRIQRETMLLKMKLDLQEASFASVFQQLQQQLNSLSDRLDKIEKRLDNMLIAQGHTITVSIIFSTDKNSLNKTVVVTASASDNLGHDLNRAAIWVDDRLVSEKTSPPWTWNLDTTRYANGQHQVKAGFWCASGGYGEKTETVKIQNAIAAGGASTSYTPTGGGGQQYEQQGCQILLTIVSPLNGSTIDKDAFSVFVKARDSIGHPVTRVSYSAPWGTGDADQCVEPPDEYTFRAFFQSNTVITITVTAVCAAGNTGSITLTYYRAGGGGGAGGPQPY
ncbi:MAG: Ig-like domain-containing protein [Thermofilum sp.]